MKLPNVMVLAFGIVGAAASPANAGPCTAQLDALQSQVDALVDATAGSGKTAVESKAATEGRQPTPESIATAEAALGEGKAAQTALAAMSDGRAADAAGDTKGCEGAIVRVRTAVGQ